MVNKSKLGYLELYRCNFRNTLKVILSDISCYFDKKDLWSANSLSDDIKLRMEFITLNLALYPLMVSHRRVLGHVWAGFF